MPAKLGQVFIKEKNIIDKICRFSDIKKSDFIVEIGCGAGILTDALVKKAESVVVIELDKKCIDLTKKTIGEPENLSFIHEDVLKVDFSQFPSDTRVIANIPYYLSAKLVQKFAYSKDVFSDMIIMVQKEFAKKLISEVGSKDYTSLTVFSKFHFDIDYLFDISKNCFEPVPKVDSAMLQLRPKFLQIENPVFFESIIKACFWGRRKKISTALKKNPYINFTKDLKDVEFLNTRSNCRAEHLSLTDYLDLYRQLL